MKNILIWMVMASLALVGIQGSEESKQEVPEYDELSSLRGSSNDDRILGRSRATTNYCPSISGYVFWSLYDSSGGDLRSYSGKSVTTLASYCNNDSTCKGFNTNGYLKGTIKPMTAWDSFPSGSNSCQGFYIKKPTSGYVNGYRLSTNEFLNLQWIATYTIPNWRGINPPNPLAGALVSKQDMYDIAKVAWWALKEQVYVLQNPWDYSLCNYATGDKGIGPLTECPVNRAWQVGIAAMHVENIGNSWGGPQDSDVVNRALAVYKTSNITYVLSQSAKQANYNQGTSTYNAITGQQVGSNLRLKRAWLLKSHLVGFYFSAPMVQNECCGTKIERWCWGNYNNTCSPCAKYAPNAATIQTRIGEVMMILQSLTSGQYVPN